MSAANNTHDMTRRCVFEQKAYKCLVYLLPEPFYWQNIIISFTPD